MPSKNQNVKPTEQEIALGEIARDSWNRYVETGVPIQNEFMRQATGLAVGENGELQVAAGGPRNADGSIRTDTTDASTAHTAAVHDAFTSVNPNTMNRVAAANQGTADSRADSVIGMGLGQQSAVLQGEQNVARMGQGLGVEQITTQSQLAAQANQTAIQSAQTAQNKAAVSSYLAGQVVGAGVGVGVHNSGYLSAAQQGSGTTNVIDATNGLGGSDGAANPSLLPTSY